MATVTPIRAGSDTRPTEPFGELLADVEIALACLEDRLVERFGRRRLGRTVIGRFEELWNGLEHARAAYHREVGVLGLSLDRLEKGMDEVNDLLDQSGLGLTQASRSSREAATMPSTQRGSVVKKGTTWAARYYDERGVRRFRGAFPTRSAAREWVDRKVDDVEALRSGEKTAPADIPTVADSSTASSRRMRSTRRRPNGCEASCSTPSVGSATSGSTSCEHPTWQRGGRRSRSGRVTRCFARSGRCSSRP